MNGPRVNEETRFFGVGATTIFLIEQEEEEVNLSWNCDKMFYMKLLNITLLSSVCSFRWALII
jgi:hypothetical protein